MLLASTSSSMTEGTLSTPTISANNGSVSYLRWKKGDDDDDKIWRMQTAVQTFQRGNQKVELHAQLHYGDKAYFEFWNSNNEDFHNRVDQILFELLVDDDLLEYYHHDHNGGNYGFLRFVKAPITASPNDRALADQYGWATQACVLDYTQPKMIHADLSRQEFVSLVEQEQQQVDHTTRRQRPSGGSCQSPPLWKLASGPQSSSAAAEAVSALLVGPPSLIFSADASSSNSSSSSPLRRRLFTNLFLPGSSLAFALRAILWTTVPSPELSIILLDWSSLIEPGTGTNPNALSKVALPILSSLVKFDFAQMRRFVFGQVLMSSNRPMATSSSSINNNSNGAWSLLVTKRNDHALKVLQEVLGEGSSDCAQSVALLYGSSHCPDLHQKLRNIGFQPTQKSWRTAWSVDESDNDRETLLPALAALLVLYLGIGALDWVGFLGGVSESFVESKYLEGAADAGLYLLRHVLFYLGLSKFLIEWTNEQDDT